MLTRVGGTGLEQMEPVNKGGVRLLPRGISMSVKLATGWVRGVLALPLMPVVLAVSASASEHAAGGLIAYEPIDISLVRQDLIVSPELVRVTYTLRSDAPQETTLAFPMPPVPVQAGPDFLGGLEINEADPRNYMHFSAQVNGNPVQPRLIESAYLGETDVEQILDAAGLPLLIPPDEASALIAQLPADQFFRLEENGIVARGGDDPPHFSPLWSYQATFEWKQDFPAGETTIEITYQPLTGIVENPVAFLQSPAMAAKYCFGQEVSKVDDDRLQVVTLSYLLAMPPFWKGPVGEFNLALDRSSPESSGHDAIAVAYCPPGGKPGVKFPDFTPAGRLEIAFIFTAVP